MQKPNYANMQISKSTELAFVRFFVSLALAAIMAIWAIYLFSFGLSESTIGFVSAIFLIVAVSSSFIVIPILEKYNQRKIIIISLAISILGFSLLSIITNLYFFLAVYLVLTINAVLRVNASDILFRDNSDDGKLNRQMSIMFCIINFAWLIGPLIAGFFLLEFGLRSVFLSAAGFYALALILFLILKISPAQKERDGLDKHILLNIINFIKDKKLHLPYLVSMGLQIWWGFVYIYIPLFIIKAGLSDGTVSIFIAFLVIPLIIFEYFVGKASEKLGFRKFFKYGFFLLSIIALALFFMNNIYLQLALVVIASIAASFIEPIDGAFFFKQVKKLDEEKYYPIFTTSKDFGAALGKFLPAIVLLFLPSSFAYLVMFILMGIFFFISLKIKEVIVPY
ncbi:MAG: MFS transporter [Candidatus ainarchaeum sp.]|nr:MFS transporter [Candidatus ainarchaeum sp.]